LPRLRSWRGAWKIDDSFSRLNPLAQARATGVVVLAKPLPHWGTRSRTLANLDAAVSLHFMHYNFARPHQTLKKANGYQTTPAMAAGIADHVWTIEELVGLLDTAA